LREKYHATIQDILKSENEILRLEAEEIDLKHRLQQQLTRSKQRLNQAKRKVSELALQLKRTKKVVSSADGRLTEIKAAIGSIISIGTPILSLESAGERLQLMLYVPPTYGKKIKPNMAVSIAPAPVRKEEFGTLMGEVIDISEFPATTQGMASVLSNENLVKQLSQQGPPYVARVNLMADKNTPSSYKWSSGKGPDMILTSGTLATAEVTVKEQAPISLVILYFKEYTGI
jgi:HlyD family secretion protein